MIEMIALKTRLLNVLIALDQLASMASGFHTTGPSRFFTHCELVIDDAWYSSSLMDGGAGINGSQLGPPAATRRTR